MDSLAQYRFLADIEIPFQIITTTSVILRFGTRAFLLRRVGIDDYAIVISWACSFGTYVTFLLVLKQITNLIENHAGLDLNALMTYVKIAAVLYVASMAVLKVSLGAFFLHIFRVHRIQRTIIWVLVVVTVCFSIANGVFAAVTCGAAAAFIGDSNQCKALSTYSSISTAWSIFNALGDLLLAALAINAIWAANMKKHTKIVAGFVLVLGTVGGAASVVRLYMIETIDKNFTASAGINLSIWTMVEMCAGITAANLACLRPLLSLVKTKLGRLRLRRRRTAVSLDAVHHARAPLNLYRAVAQPILPDLTTTATTLSDYTNPLGSHNSTHTYALEWELQYEKSLSHSLSTSYPYLSIDDSSTSQSIRPPPRVYGVLPDA
ncbi:hypothetical protein K461DRAFT_296271 [Myriangium duriaei CBS 260.36]|uniref:Rhodopsin domain-containing protein n=1 Tax=Myriangium duriaei CBS 260.36 TaxID=1168546 RepID=A0A9P4IZX5_9PEZI|nr:hypothetical protein K461DRAFT_296271 [Myriangium duriaei CBS 260.36]